MKKILIMGLPGSGKTTLASKLVPLLKMIKEKRSCSMADHKMATSKKTVSLTRA